MEKAFGYSQMKFNYITDCANNIAESAVRMEMAWQNRKHFKNVIDLDVWLQEQVSDIERKLSELSSYIEPLDYFYEEKEE